MELGAGLGLCSIVAHRMGLRVVATDGDESVLSSLRRNACRNGVLSEDNGDGEEDQGQAQATLRTRLLQWGRGCGKENATGADAGARGWSF